MPVYAQAETNPGIKVSDLTLVRSTTDGIDAPGESLTRWNVVRLTYDWDASSADVKSGDSFTVGLGSYLRNLEFPRTADMTVAYDGEQVTIGTCQLSRADTPAPSPTRWSGSGRLASPASGARGTPCL